MQQRNLGELAVPAIGLGCMGMSAFYGTTDEGEAIATIHRALERDGNLFDTAEGERYDQAGMGLLNRSLDPTTVL